ncbi:hypothetical protein PHAVU_008G252900 [Phaseolus vulgaris]|uniref:Uncharacterized protein n=1 Tax=Phaseolus vulgaris TaxID=3885 RepID=V7BB63_PHAVU|nr:hypothetical protein PHAVU_008G252900g [Phaseolus vulgaris]ESW14098.1 hypothetical protein PHAVU_008G252900g [Phaseolus vulgaris]
MSLISVTLFTTNILVGSSFSFSINYVYICMFFFGRLGSWKMVAESMGESVKLRRDSTLILMMLYMFIAVYTWRYLS